MIDLIKNIKKSEGFVGEVYKDHLGFDTLGYGTKLPLDQEEAEMLLKHRLFKKQNELIAKKPIVKELSEARQNVLYEMAYQLGNSGLMKFKKMWEAIEEKDYLIASLEMLNSRWAIQTPSRARDLALVMQG